MITEITVFDAIILDFIPQVIEISCKKSYSMQKLRNGFPEMSASIQKMTKGKISFWCHFSSTFCI